MKKITFIVLAILAFFQSGFGQANILVKAPPGNNATTQVRAPNGNSSHTTMRGCFLVSQAELTPYMLPGTNISTFGFTLTAGISGSPVSGNFTVYLQNTNDATYLKGTSFTTAIAPMSTVYNGNMTIPVSASSTSINLTLASPFTYTGGGIYVAYDWASSGPFSSTVATYMADNSISPGGASNSTTVAPANDVLGITAFRPVFLFGAANTATNDVQVQAIEAPGSIPAVLNSGHNIKAIIKNGSNAALANIPVYLNVTGANSFANTQTVTSLASGATTTVTFASFNPQINGVNTISVTVDPDQLPNNNSKSYSQTVTCNVFGQNPQPATYTAGVGFNTGSGIIGAKLVPPVNATVTGARLGISSDAGTNGKSIYGVLLNAAGTILATSNTITISAGMLNTFQNVNFPIPQNVTAGTTYYIGLAQPAGTAYFPVGSTPSQYIPANLYVTTFTAGGVPSPITQNLGYFGLEAVFAHTTAITASAASSVVCAGSSVALNANGASTYVWSTGASGASVVVTPTSATTVYSVTGTNSIGCTALTTVSVNTTPSPTITISGNNTVMCSGGTASLTASGADTYTWNTTATGSQVTVNPTVTTVYNVIGTSTASGCSATSTIAVSIDTPTITVSGPTAICNGTAAALYAGGASTYTWSTGSTGTAIAVSPNVTTSYSIAGTNTTGCSSAYNFTVIVNPNPTVTAISGTSLLCQGQSATLTANGALSYTWSGGAASSTLAISPTITTTYSVTGTNTFGCTNTATVTQNVSACTGIALQSAHAGIEVYPNPSNGLLTLSLNSVNENCSVEIHNVLGMLITRQTLNSEKTIIDIQDHLPGIYIIRIKEGSNVLKVSTLIKQ